MGAVLAGKTRRCKSQPDDGIAADCLLCAYWIVRGQIARDVEGHAVDTVAFPDNAGSAAAVKGNIPKADLTAPSLSCRNETTSTRNLGYCGLNELAYRSRRPRRHQHN